MTRVLLVDDTETVRMSITMMLAGHGYDVETAKNGAEALTKVEESRPDIVLMDVVMPELDGIETCRRLKLSPSTRDIPVVMITTRGEADRVEEALRAGCDGYLTKPVRKLELLQKLRAHVD